MPPKNNINNDIKTFDILKRAVMDSSAIIYLSKLDLLELLLNELRIFIPDAIFNETGLNRFTPFEIISMPDPSSADQKVVRLASQKHCAVISDDKKILQQAKILGLDYFNSLMMVLFLFSRDVIDARTTESKLANLQGIAWYNSTIWQYGWQLFKAIKIEKEVG